jgi:hypothetical protein
MIRIRTLIVGALLSAVASLSAVGLAAPSYALGPGEVCMFDAPSGAEVLGANYGHVGWGYLIGGSTTWVFGATESATYHWHTSGDWNTMLSIFSGNRYGHAAGYYTKYKCKTTSTSSVGAANTAVSTSESNGYDALTNNCLTKSVAIFNAYYGFNLYWGGYEGPNYYFDNLAWPGPYYL